VRLLAIAALSFLVACVDPPSGAVGELPATGVRVPIAIAAGTDETCAVLERRSNTFGVGAADGSVAADAGVAATEIRCWGAGQDRPVVPPRSPDAPVAVATGSVPDSDDPTRCVLDEGGQVICWGANDSGQAGSPENPYSNPSVVAGLPAATRVTVGVDGGHTCALADRSLWCWGSNSNGQLGDGGRVDTHVPQRVALDRVTDFAVGGRHTCAVAEGGQLYCWGADEAGQAGGNVIAGPSSVSVPGGARRVVAGRFHTCVVSGAGEVSCFGSNGRGQLGRDPGEESSSLELVSLPESVGEIAAGAAHTCAVGDRAVYCWGANDQLQLGVPMVPDALLVPLDLEATALALGESHSCALTLGAVYCWGDGSRGQLGEPSAGTSGPTLVPNLR